MQQRSLRTRDVNIFYGADHSQSSTYELGVDNGYGLVTRKRKIRHHEPQTTPPTTITKLQKSRKHNLRPSAEDHVVSKPSPHHSLPSKGGKKKKTSSIMKNHSDISAQHSLPQLPDFEPFKHAVPLHEAYNTLPKDMRSLDLKPVHIGNLFFPDSILDVIVTNTNLYADQQLEQNSRKMEGGRGWVPISRGRLRIWLGISIHMGVVGVPPDHYWRHDGKLFGTDGLPTTRFMSKTQFEQIRRYLHISNPVQPLSDSSRWYHKVAPLLSQLRYSSQAYRVPSSNVTMDEAMIRFTRRSIHVTKMPNKPIGQGYKFFALADKGYVWDFHPSSNTCSIDPVGPESECLGLSKTGAMVHHLITKLKHQHKRHAFNVYMDNYFTSIALCSELRKMGVGACGTAKPNFKGFPKELNVGKKAKLDYHFRSGVVKDNVAVLLWMDSAPVTMMSTIHPLSGDESQALKERWHPGQKSTNAAGANTVFDSNEKSKLLPIPVIILAYNMYKVGVDTADQYRTYYDTQLISRRNWWPIFYWVLETVLINSFIIYREAKDSKKDDINHLDFRLETAWSFIESGIEETTGLGKARRKHSLNTTAATPHKKQRVTEKTTLPILRNSSEKHLPIHMESRVDCFLCGWRRSQGSGEDPKKRSIECSTCNEPLCFSKERNCYYDFHHM